MSKTNKSLITTKTIEEIKNDFKHSSTGYDSSYIFRKANEEKINSLNKRDEFS